jgi:RNA polymerase sigma-70 factor (ECF subfamily)
MDHSIEEPMTDVFLVTRARSSDAAAFDELVRRHHRTVYRAALAIVRSPTDADDVTQEAWLRAYLDLASFDGTASLRTWLVSIRRNHAIDRYRTTRRRWQREETSSSQDSIVARRASHDRTPEELVLQNERRLCLARCIDALPVSLREPLRRWHSGQYTFAEIAAISDAATGTIKSRVWEARLRVKRQFHLSTWDRHGRAKGLVGER